MFEVRKGTTKKGFLSCSEGTLTMQLFYTTQVFDDNFALITDREWQHCTRVLRYRVGDVVHFVDGSGTYFTGTLVEAGKSEGRVRIDEVARGWKKRGYQVHIAIAPTKQVSRMEWMLEKLVELGVDQVTFLKTARSERHRLKMDRLEKIAIAAMKQSLHAYLPSLSGMMPFPDFIAAAGDQGKRYIAYLSGDSVSISANYMKGNDVIILIGPEGDFTGDEVAQAVKRGFTPVHLGASRLRTETAAIAACHTVHLMNQS